MTQLGRVRSVLFAPAVRTDFLEKLPTRGADAVVIDCEDATPPDAKAEGRRNARTYAPLLADQGCQVMVRVNAQPTQWFAADIAEGLGPRLAAVVVPKVETTTGLTRMAAALDGAGLDELGILAGLETALGVADSRTLLAHPRVIAGYFGAEDFIADMGGVRTSTNIEVLHARSAVVVAGRLAGVPVIDQVVTNFSDNARFVTEASQARSLGYRGKLCIHPDQVPLANAAFVPSRAEVERARRLLAAYDEALVAGVAAIDFEGQMVDEPLAAQARHIVELAGDDSRA